MKFDKTIRKSRFHAFAILLLCGAGATNSRTLNGMRHDKCHYDEKSMGCYDCIPKTIPEYVTGVELVDIDYQTLVDGVFCHPSWGNLIQLSIRCDKRCAEIGYIFDGVFRCLDNLRVLKVSLQKWYINGKKAFTGLPKVSLIDLSGCFKICTPDIITILSDSGQIPGVTELVLSGTGNNCRPQASFVINQTLFDLFASRNITSVDLSSTQIHCDPVNITCTSLSTLNLSNAEIEGTHKIENRFNCSSLRVVDMSGIKLAVDAILKSVYNLTSNTPVLVGEKRYPPLLSSVSRLYLNRLVSDTHAFYFRNISVRVVAKNNLKEFYFCGYNIPKFDVEFNFTHNHMENLVLSNNRMEDIGFKVFRNFPFLRRVDISHNNLGSSKTSSEAFSVLFRENYQLEEIIAANNNILFLPRNTFLSNMLLEKLDLAGNKMKQLTFEISHLTRLKVLDMRNNSIETLDSFSRQAVDKLYSFGGKKHISIETNASLLVDLRGNPFTCDCRSLDFLTWFVESPIFLSTRYTYLCKADGQNIPMGKAAILAAENDCERPKRRMRKILLASILPAFGAVVVSIGIRLVIKKRKERLRIQRLEDRTRLIQDGDLDMTFLAFLSFSSEDERFVAANVLQPLTVICISQFYYFK